VLLVSDPNVVELHGMPLRNRLHADGLRVAIQVVPTGEKAKTIEALADLYNALGNAAVDRQGLIVGLGGGTVGDVAGFAAATWMRGIRYLHVPTTLLAMVDSSIGGKTGINLPAGKNMAGALHQPEAIFADLEYLSTLPAPEYRSAIAEIIKSALIADQPFCDWLSSNMNALVARSSTSLQYAVASTIAIKAAVVSKDPQEIGLRAILNYGHTVGHALERALGYGVLPHGEAVAWGMEVAARIAVISERCTADVARVQHQLLHEAGLLERRPSVGKSALLEALRHDKKARAGEARWVLLRDRGKAEYGCQVPAEVVSRAVSEVLPV
jgi:3-dehydroquinate synthase